jgi:hypothetical protein
MKKIISTFCLNLLFASNPTDYLNDKIPITNQRYETFKYALELLEERNINTIVETGTARHGSDNFEGDGGSTIIFSEWAVGHDADFFSIDISNDNIANAKNAVASNICDKNNQIHFICSDSIEYLNNFGRSIDFLYLDSFDYELDNPEPSQDHHLKEILAAYPLLTEKCVVMIDDCVLAGGGKGKLVIDFLKQKGWQIVKDSYQVILIR